jgi:hypothetical protein
MNGHLVPAAQRPARRFLVCGVCGRERLTTPEQQMKYVSSGWPKCCGAVMTLFVEPELAEKPPDEPSRSADSSA